MSKKLKNNLSSMYLGAARKLSPASRRRRIVAYVESYDDVAFWRSILSKYEDEEHYFQIMLPSQTSLSKGKKMVLMNSLNTDNLGENLIACIDSDYDYILQDSTPLSHQINTNKYILQTYAYAIENYQCFAESLHEVCVQATLNDRALIDFPAFLKSYSQIVYPLFVWHTWLHRIGNGKLFPIYKFSDYTALQEVDVKRPEKALKDLSQRVDLQLRKTKQCYGAYQEEVSKFEKELNRLGITPETTYLYVQGHHLFERVVLKVLNPVCAMLRREREDEIRRLAVHSKQYHNELSCYENTQMSVAIVLKKNDNFKELDLYKHLEEDIKNLFKEQPAEES